MSNMSNMRFYDAARTVPQEAQKPIQAGRLKGMTDVNPMYRIKRLTEIFGPCGLGWWYVIKDERIVDDEITGQRAAFVDIDLFYKDPASGEASMAIPGTGGAAFVSKERSGPYMSDECFKMALTDAIGVAAKALGVAADVYWQKDRTKYSGWEAGTGRPSAAAGTSSDPGEAGATFPRGEGSQAGTGTVRTGVGVDFRKGRREERATSSVTADAVPPVRGTVSRALDAPKGEGSGETAQAANGPATATQKQWISDNATANDYMRIMQTYGPNLERLSMKGAIRVIEQIRTNNAAGGGIVNEEERA